MKLKETVPKMRAYVVWRVGVFDFIDVILTLCLQLSIFYLQDMKVSKTMFHCHIRRNYSDEVRHR